MSLSTAKIRDLVTKGFKALGGAVVTFTVTDKGKVFDPDNNVMTGSDATISVEGVYSDSDVEFVDESNVIILATEITLSSLIKSTTTVFTASLGDVLVDSIGVRNTILKILPTRFGVDTVLQTVLCK
ncbi:MAG: hypothetical protein CMB80_15055 [Flammeovirgaceae bacterium]|nr:hypothetical protein [Flammeovirgaceae bacterium]|tara:strand:- start:672 stop:1052 length:381 start_codon:yes stop_codon:yes gene_type:complete